MAIQVTVTSVEIIRGEMVVQVETTNTDYPSIPLTFSVLEGSSQTLVGVKYNIDKAAQMMWIGYGNPSWEVVAG